MCQGSGARPRTRPCIDPGIFGAEDHTGWHSGPAGQLSETPKDRPLQRYLVDARSSCPVRNARAGTGHHRRHVHSGAGGGDPGNPQGDRLLRRLPHGFIGTDHRDDRQEIGDALPGRCAHRPGGSPTVDLYVFARADLFIANCVSSFSALAVREREAFGRPHRVRGLLRRPPARCSSVSDRSSRRPACPVPEGGLAGTPPKPGRRSATPSAHVHRRARPARMRVPQDPAAAEGGPGRRLQ